VGRCFALVFDKHRPAFAAHPRALERTCRTNADFVSARIARFNRQRITQMFFLGRAFLRTPSLFVRRAIGSIAQRVST
jgi:UDP:flavonoid glycosyltransferase YjiC (YdhE family)